MLKERLFTINRSLLEVGPQFKLSGQMDANFELDIINAAVDLNYPLSGISFAFPPKSGSQLSGITPSTKRESCLYFRHAQSCPY